MKFIMTILLILGVSAVLFYWIPFTVARAIHQGWDYNLKETLKDTH